MTTFQVGDFVRNYPCEGVIVEGVVAEVLEDGSPVIAANFRGEYVRFPANPGMTERVA